MINHHIHDIKRITVHHYIPQIPHYSTYKLIASSCINLVSNLIRDAIIKSPGTIPAVIELLLIQSIIVRIDVVCLFSVAGSD